MNDHPPVEVAVTFDPQQIDDTGYAWTWRCRAHKPDALVPGAIVLTGPADSPRFARVIDVIERGDDAIVHLDELDQTFDDIAAALTAAGLTIAST